MASALAYLHDECHMTHNDLHNDQWIIKNNGIINLSDFSVVWEMPANGVVEAGS
jgi:hypothetical protein